MVSQPNLRPIKAQDIIDMYGDRVSTSIRGWTAELDGRVIGVAGIAFTKPLQCFSKISDEMKEYPRQVIEAVWLIRKLCRETRLPVYATADVDEPTAHRFLKHVGFQELEEGLYLWHG